MADSEPKETFALTTSRGFESILARTGVSLAFTTYQAGKLFLLGLKPDGRLAVFERTFARCMGMAVSADARSLLLATHYQLFRFDNALPTGEQANGHDALYVPRVSWITGDLDIHDVAFGASGRPVFINTRFSCLAEASEGWSFRPVWQPPFITKLAAEDRCHLNGMAAEQGRPRYVTMVSRSNVADGWRDRRSDGGIIMDVTTNEIVCDGLSMPHSPRLHDCRLWVLNSGAGQFGWVDVKARKFHEVAFCPGYARGLAFAGQYAYVGLSLSRESRTFQGLPLDNALQQNGADARCGLLVIDTQTGDIAGWVRLEGVVRELYDVAALPGVRNPSALGFKTDEIQRVITIDEGVATPDFKV